MAKRLSLSQRQVPCCHAALAGCCEESCTSAGFSLCPDPPLQAPGGAHKLNYLQHREEKVAADLALIAGLLSNSRDNGTIGDMGATYNTQASMKMSGKDMTAKMATTSVLKRTIRSKCKPHLMLCWQHGYSSIITCCCCGHVQQAACVCECVHLLKLYGTFADMLLCYVKWI